jgi:hypothetical protein
MIWNFFAVVGIGCSIAAVAFVVIFWRELTGRL